MCWGRQGGVSGRGRVGLDRLDPLSRRVRGGDVDVRHFLGEVAGTGSEAATVTTVSETYQPSVGIPLAGWRPAAPLIVGFPPSFHPPPF